MEVNAEIEVFVAAFGAQRILKLDKSGSITTYYESEGSWSPTGLCFGETGTLFVLEYSKSNQARLVKITGDGRREIFEP